MQDGNIVDGKEKTEGEYQEWRFRRARVEENTKRRLCFGYANTSFVPGVTGGFCHWRPRLSTLGREAVAAAVITSGHAGWEGSPKTNQLCVQGRGHAHTSRMIDFTRQPVPTQP